MSDNNSPDKANDLNEDLDVPTYTPASQPEEQPVAQPEEVIPADSGSATTSGSEERKDVFSWEGRATPKKIDPVASEPTETFSSPPEPSESTVPTDATEPVVPAAPSKSLDSTETEVLSFDRPEPAPVYHDEDFAPASAPEQSHPETLLAPSTLPTPSREEEALALNEPGAAQLGEESPQDSRIDSRRGTIDLGLFLVRIALSAYLIVAGLGAFFGLGGSEGTGGLSGLESEFADYALPAVLAIVVPTLQLIAGAFLLFGLVFPLAAAVSVVATTFGLLHTVAYEGAGVDVFAWTAEVWLAVILVFLAVALQFSGPGFISADFKRSWARRPLASSWIWLVIAIAAATALWWFGVGLNPLA